MRINDRLLRWLTVVLPVGFVVALLAFSDVVFVEGVDLLEVLFILILASVGTVVFSSWIFSLIERREGEIERRASLLKSLNEASIALTTELDLNIVLQRVVDLSCELVSATYGALGVLNDENTKFEQFITSGVLDEERQLIGEPPHGEGIFKIMLEQGDGLLLDKIESHERFGGFPDAHPMMETLIGVPIILKGEVIGDLYLANKVDDGKDIPQPFTEDDRLILEMFSNQAAIAIDNARLYRQTQQLAVLEERQRFGMDLHDGVIQSIYAVGLTLGEMKRRVNGSPKGLDESLDNVINALNMVVTDIRNYILDLRPGHFQGRDVAEGVNELARALRANTFMNVLVDTEDLSRNLLDERQTLEVLHIAKEALTNIQKHARASEVEIRLGCHSNEFQMVIMDNGVSIPLEKLEESTGNGLVNMNERANLLGGEIVIAPRAEGGTTISLSFNTK